MGNDIIKAVCEFCDKRDWCEARKTRYNTTHICMDCAIELDNDTSYTCGELLAMDLEMAEYHRGEA